ncbi:MAG: hypothetical protein RBU30_23900, partial [Polyangia bacterium]|nr:hypothetical protein [Polyangia bacterium]
GRAYDLGIMQYQRFLVAYRELGRKVLREVEENPDRVFVALLGGPTTPSPGTPTWASRASSPPRASPWSPST